MFMSGEVEVDGHNRDVCYTAIGGMLSLCVGCQYLSVLTGPCSDKAPQNYPQNFCIKLLNPRSSLLVWTDRSIALSEKRGPSTYPQTTYSFEHVFSQSPAELHYTFEASPLV